MEPPTFRSRLEWALVFAAALLFLFVPSRHITGDGVPRFVDLKKLVDMGEVSPFCYSYIGPLGALPLYKAGQAIEWWRGSKGGSGPQRPTYKVTAQYNALLWLAAAGLFAWALRDAAPDIVRRRFLLLLLFGTMAAHGVRDFYGEVFTAVLVGAGIAVAVLRRARWGWLLVPIGAANTAGSFLGLALVVARQVWDSRRLRYGLLLAAAVLLYLVEGRWKFGAWGQTGYENNHGYATVLPYSGRPGFSYPIFFGVLGLLFSFGKGLLFFAPGCFLPMGLRLRQPQWAALHACQALWLCFLAGLVLLYAKWWAWYGGGSFGPRFVLFAALPASLALAVYLERPSRRWAVNVAVLAALALSLWVGVCGTIFYPVDIPILGANQCALEHLEWYVPEFSPLWHPLLEPHSLKAGEWLWCGFALLLWGVLGADHLAALGRSLRKALA